MDAESFQLLRLAMESATTIVIAYLAFKTAGLTRGQAVITASQHAVAGKIGELEKNTNSIKDALVKVTGDEAHARGVKEERDRQHEIVMQVAAAKKDTP